MQLRVAKLRVATRESQEGGPAVATPPVEEASEQGQPRAKGGAARLADTRRQRKGALGAPFAVPLAPVLCALLDSRSSRATVAVRSRSGHGHALVLRAGITGGAGKVQ